MKKILISILIVLLLTGCGDKKKEETNTKTTTKKGETTTTTVKNPIPYVYEYSEVQKDTSDGNIEKEYVVKLYLLEDHTYWMVSGYPDNLETEYGTYNDDHLFSDKVYTPNEDCYFDEPYYTYDIAYTDTGIKLTKIYSSLSKTETILTKKENTTKLKDIQEQFIDVCTD